MATSSLAAVTVSLMTFMAFHRAVDLTNDLPKTRSTTSSASDVDQADRPLFRHTPKNITVGPGQRAVLKCRVENLGTKTVTWKRSDAVHPLTIGLFPFAPDTRISVDHNQRTNEWSLVIQDVRPLDEGIYQCQISTKNEHDTYDIRLNVKNIQIIGTEYVERGSTIELVCNATGKPEPPHDVEWLKGDGRINSDAANGVIITKKIETKVLVSILVIRQSMMSDSGKYTCRSSNQESETFEVHVVNVSAVEKRGTNAEKTVGASTSDVPGPLRQPSHVTSSALFGTAVVLATTIAATVFAR